MHALKTMLVPGLTSLAAFATVGSAADLPQDLAGRYAHYDVVAYDDTTPLGVMKSLVITYGFTDLRVEGDHLVESETFCHAEQKSNLPIKTTVADSFTRAILPREAVPTVTMANGQVLLHRPETPTGLGIRLVDAHSDALPTDPNDPRITDDDHDGHPGVTVDLDLGFIKGQLYLARREIFAYDLTYVSEGRFEGIVHDRSEQLTVGANPSFLAAQHHPVQNADLSRSLIILRRLGADYTCDRLMAERDQWFPASPDVAFAE